MDQSLALLLGGLLFAVAGCGPELHGRVGIVINESNRVSAVVRMCGDAKAAGLSLFNHSDDSSKAVRSWAAKEPVGGFTRVDLFGSGDGSPWRSKTTLKYTVGTTYSFDGSENDRSASLGGVRFNAKNVAKLRLGMVYVGPYVIDGAEKSGYLSQSQFKAFACPD